MNAKNKINPEHSVLCPIGLLLDNGITSFSKEIYLYVRYRCKFFEARGMEFYESYATIASIFHVSPRTVRRSVDELVTSGWIVKKSSGKRDSLILSTREP